MLCIPLLCSAGSRAPPPSPPSPALPTVIWPRGHLGASARMPSLYLSTSFWPGGPKLDISWRGADATAARRCRTTSTYPSRSYGSYRRGRTQSLHGPTGAGSTGGRGLSRARELLPLQVISRGGLYHPTLMWLETLSAAVRDLASAAVLTTLQIIL